MRALILLAHGSRNAAANAEVVALAASLDGVGSVRAAFLELARPTLSEAVAALASEGVVELVVLPMFLNTGRHVEEHVPQLVARAEQDHLGVRIAIASHIGAGPEFTAFVLARARAAVVPD